MDLDAYTAVHGAEWARLDALAAQHVYSGPEADELIERFQAGATQLSVIKTSAGSSAQGDRLSVALSRARLRFTGTAGNLLETVPRFFALQLPAALFRLRWVTLAVALASAVVALLYAWWVLADPRAMAAFGSQASFQQLVKHDFVDYYSANPAASFAGQVWTNNAWIAAQCIAFGIIGVYVPYIVLQNATNIGVTGAVMFAYGRGDVFFSYITPHGLLELTSVFVAAAAGLRIFWAWIAPGARTRSRALASEARAMFTVVVGLAMSLFVSGIIEAFVTPSPLPVWAKISIGALALAAFLFYMLVVGRRAARAGETGDLTGFDAGADRLAAG